MALRTRITAAVAFLTLVLAVAGGVAYDAYLDHATRATLAHALLRRAARVQLAIAERAVTLPASGDARPVPDQAVVQVASAHRMLYTTGLAGGSPLLTDAEQSRARVGPIWLVRSSRLWSSPHLILAEAVRGAPGDVLAVGTSMDPVRDSMRAAREGLVVAGVLVVLAAAWGAWLFAGYALRPVDQLRAEAEALAAGRSEALLGVPATHDELAALAGTFNSMLARSRESSVRQRNFVAAASHELRTPLAGMRADLEMASRGVAVRGLENRLAARVEHLSEVCDGLLAVAEGHRASIVVDLVVQPLEPLVAQSLETLAPAAEDAGVALVLDAESGAAAAVDPVRFRQIMDNLIANAVAHSPSGAAVVVSVLSEHHGAAVEVRDQGPGFGEEMLASAFEPFVKGRRQHGRSAGYGLGLTIVDLVVRAHGGSVELVDMAGGGASARVLLPLQHSDGARGARPLLQRARRHLRGAAATTRHRSRTAPGPARTKGVQT